MLKKYIIITLFLLIKVISIAQPLSDAKRDYVWKLGYDGYGGNPNWGLMTLTFNQTGISSMTSIIDSSSFNATNSSICDSLGGMVFYTNGVFIRDTNDDLITIDTLNPGYFANNYYDGYPFFQSSIVLPLPNDSYLYYLIHQKMNNPIPNSISKGEGLYYTVIDSRLRNGKSGIISWRNLIVRDTLESGKVNASRHANGRDWWITCWHKNHVLLSVPYICTPILAKMQINYSTLNFLVYNLYGEQFKTTFATTFVLARYNLASTKVASCATR